MTTKRFAIIDCEDAEKWRAQNHLWITALGCEGEVWDTFSAPREELPTVAAAASYTGLVLTGSHYDAHDDTKRWIVKLKAFLKAVVAEHRSVRVFGACFGCQVLAAALGGASGPNPSGEFVVGSETLLLTAALETRADFRYALQLEKAAEAAAGARGGAAGAGGEAGGGAARRVVVLESHGDQVLALPPDATLLASSATAPIEAWSLDTAVLAFQGHPEMSPALVKALILPALLEKNRIGPEQMAAAAESMQVPLSSLLLLDMVRYYLHGAPVKAAPPAASLTATVAAFGEAGLPALDYASAMPAPAGGQLKGALALPKMLQSMLWNVTAAIQGELRSTCNEYELLSKMNKLAAEKYKQMADFAEGMAVFVERLQAKDEAFRPYTQQIDEIDRQVAIMEEVVSKLDISTKQLEARFRKIALPANK